MGYIDCAIHPSDAITHQPEEYWGDDSFFKGEAPLSLASGYIIVLGMGCGMTLLAMFLTWVGKLGKEDQAISSEYFNTAGRSVKTGLTASVIVSQWTWAATLLQSSNVAWNFGVSGPFWYASGATIQVLLFGIIAIEIKRKCPTAHTMLEILRARWPGAHIHFMFFAFSTNLIVTSMLILGGAATINALTGMDVYLASFLIPISVIPYTMYGGLKSTFLASYIHTSIIFIVLVMMIYTIYVQKFSSDLIFEMLKATTGYSKWDCMNIFSSDFNGTASPSLAAGSYSELNFYDESGSDLTVCLDNNDCTKLYACGGVDGNMGVSADSGSYLTMISLQGLMFGIINIVGNFGTVFCDQSYWQSAIAAEPTAAHKGYIVGGLVWFAIPFSLASSLGLAATALQLPISKGEASAGLVPPAVAVHLLGAGGGWAIATMLFMAIISTGSAEAIAVSSLVSYDIYMPYINVNANSDDIIRISRIVIPIYCIFAGVLSSVLALIGIGLGWVYGFMGIHIGCAVGPIWFMLTWDKATEKGAICGVWAGCISGYVMWIVTCLALGDPLDKTGLGSLESMLAGNLASIVVSPLVCMAMSKSSKERYDWKSMKAIQLLDDDQSGLDSEDLSDEKLLPALNWIWKTGGVSTFLLVVAWPAFSAAAGTFTKSYWAFWVFLVVAWGLIAAITIIFLPIYESFDDLVEVTHLMFGGKAEHTPIDQKKENDAENSVNSI